MTLKKDRACDIVIGMGKGKAYPEKRDIRAVAVLLAAQGMIRLGEIPDPMNGRTALDAEGARFFIDLLRELQHKTRGNLLPDEIVFLEDVLKNMRKIFAKKTAMKNG